MDGWRARIGLLIPSVNMVMETDFRRWLPRDIMAHAARVLRTDMNSTLDQQYGILEGAGEAAAGLMHAQPDVVVLGCTAATVARGTGADRSAAAALAAQTGVPCISTATAVVEAMRALGCRRVSMVTPYLQEINDVEVAFLEGYGFEVLSEKGLQVAEGGRNIPLVPPEEVYRFARAHTHPQADCLFVSCTNFRAGEVIGYLERDLGRPVVTSTQASLWAALRVLGVGDTVQGAGRLLADRVLPLRDPAERPDANATREA